MKTSKTKVKTGTDAYRSLSAGKISAQGKQKGGPRATKTESGGDLRASRGGKV